MILQPCNLLNNALFPPREQASGPRDGPRFKHHCLKKSQRKHCQLPLCCSFM